nr:2-hydroxyacyl-CoA dehydratase family protein [Rhodococcus sp. 06-621-2]
MTDTVGERYRSLPELAKDAANDGVPVIGFVGTDTPVELIDATGALAYRLGSVAGPLLAEARHLLGSAVDYPALSILTQILSGELDFLRGIVVSRDCQASLRLFYVLRQLQVQGRAVPESHLVDLLHLPRESTARYNLSQVRRVSATVAEWTGSAVHSSDVRYAIDRREQVRTALLGVQTRRRGTEPTVTGTDALRLHAVAQRSLPEEALDFIRSVDPVPARDGASLRLFVTGSTQDEDTNYDAVESAGAHIVGEDHSWGDLALGIAPAVIESGHLDDMFDALARARQRGGPAAQTSGLRDRADYSTHEIAASGAQAVLSFARANDPAPEWDFPMLQTTPTLILRGAEQCWSSGDLADAVGALRATQLEGSRS